MKFLNTLVTIILFHVCLGWAEDLTEKCQSICSDLLDLLDVDEACRREIAKHPRPKLGDICKDAFIFAVNNQCPSVCQSRGGMRALKNQINSHCNVFKGERPYPIVYQSCVYGFEQGIRRLNYQV